MARSCAGSISDTAYSSQELAPHTDCSYLSSPQDLQMFNCVRSAGVGGATRLVDGFSVCEHMRRHHPETFGFLSSVPLPFYCWNTADSEIATHHAPVIGCGARAIIARCAIGAVHARASQMRAQQDRSPVRSIARNASSVSERPRPTQECVR